MMRKIKTYFMNFLKGIGAFLYSFVHSWLIDLIVIGMIYVIINIF